jgi:ribonuclease P protein component
VSQKRRRLSRSAEFDRVYRHGTSASSRHLVLYAFPRGRVGESEALNPEAEQGNGPGYVADEGSRLGVSVGRRVGGAVVRNRVKRQLREAFWSVAGELPGDHDFVIVARSDADGLAERDGAGGFERELRDLARKLGWTGQGDGDGAAD